MPPEGLAGKCGDPASLTFSYDVHPTGSLLYCAGRPGLRCWLAALRFTLQLVFLWRFRMGAKRLFSAGFGPGSPAERRHPRLPGRVRPQAERQHPGGPVAADGGRRRHFPAGRSASHRESLAGEEGPRESGLTALVQGGGGSSTRATTAPWPPARWRRPRPLLSSPRCCRVGLAAGCAAII